MVSPSSTKVLLIANIPPGGVDVTDGYRHRIDTIIATLSNSGFDVRVLWLYRAHDFSKIMKSALRKRRRRDFFRPVLPFYHNRIMACLSRKASSLWLKGIGARFPFHIIHAETPLGGAICSEFRGKVAIVVDFHGDLPAEMEMNNYPPWKVRLAVRDETEALKNATAILAASDALVEELTSRYKVRGVASASAPCGVNIKRFAESQRFRNAHRASLNLQDRIVYCYLGGLQKWQNIEETIALFKELYRRDKRSYLLIITNSNTTDCKQELSDIGECGENYNFMSLNTDEVHQYLPVADFGFLLRADSPVNRVASPTKFGEYLAAGLPVITTSFAGDAARIVAETGCGFMVDSVNDETLAGLTAYIAHCMERRGEVFEACKETAQIRQSWEVSENAIVGLYRKLLGTGDVEPAMPLPVLATTQEMSSEDGL